MDDRGQRYRVQHETHYAYGGPVALAQHILHLTPRVCSWQRLESMALTVDPAPAHRRDGIDAFGNPMTRIGIEASHDTLEVASTFTVAVRPRPMPAERDAERPWDALGAALQFAGSAPLDPRRYRNQSPYVRVKSQLAEYARPSFPPGRGVQQAACDLMARIHADFRFDPTATAVGTSVVELLERRRGVCQDFAHFMIGALRALGLAVRYVSGYLLTNPPPGQPRLIGADASHAWVALHIPATDAGEASDGHWLELDPTNNCLADERHIVVAWGRDFGDVSPLRGVIQGGGEHELRVSVTVMPLVDDEAKPPA